MHILGSHLTLIFILSFFVEVRSKVIKLHMRDGNNHVIVNNEIGKKVLTNIGPGNLSADYYKGIRQYLENDSHQRVVFRRILRHANDENNDEIMKGAEMYFRPLSRYRELQEEKKKHTHTKSENHVADNSNHKHQVFSVSPEYCLAIQQGYVCFYRIPE